MLAPTFVVYVWQTQSELAHLRTLPPKQLPGEVVMFYSLNCNGCKEMLPVVQELQNAGYRLKSIDLNQNSTVAKEFNVRSVPAFIYSRNGKEQFRTVSMMSRSRLEEFCRGMHGF
jgi:thioredoxin-like negative regulator of GroEL